MASTLNPYLSFRDNAREAMEFYQAALRRRPRESTPSVSTATRTRPRRT